MRYLAIALALAGSFAAAIPAHAACPPGTSYQCQQGYNGKVVCGCR
jgi:hypothetical protein